MRRCLWDHTGIPDNICVQRKNAVFYERKQEEFPLCLALVRVMQFTGGSRQYLETIDQFSRGDFHVVDKE